MSTKMLWFYKKIHSSVSRVSNTSPRTLQYFTGRNSHRSGYTFRASRFVAFLPLKIVCLLYSHLSLCYIIRSMNGDVLDCTSVQRTTSMVRHDQNSKRPGYIVYMSDSLKGLSLLTLDRLCETFTLSSRRNAISVMPFIVSLLSFAGSTM